MKKPFEMNDNQKTIYNTLKDATEGMTLAEINAANGTNIQSGSMNALLTQGIVAVTGERTIDTTVSRKHKVFGLTADANDKIKARKKPLNEAQQIFVTALAQGEATLAEINANADKEIKSGSINTLSAEGIVEVRGEKAVAGIGHRKVQVYALAEKQAA